MFRICYFLLKHANSQHDQVKPITHSTPQSYRHLLRLQVQYPKSSILNLFKLFNTLARSTYCVIKLSSNFKN